MNIKNATYSYDLQLQICSQINRFYVLCDDLKKIYNLFNEYYQKLNKIENIEIIDFDCVIR